MLPISTHIADLPALAAGLPQMDTFFGNLTQWLIHIITVGGGFFLVIDMAKHIFSSPRDLRAAGIDLLVFTILLVIANQAKSIADAAYGLFS
jgi:hypothetical protein